MRWTCSYCWTRNSSLFGGSEIRNKECFSTEYGLNYLVHTLPSLKKRQLTDNPSHVQASTLNPHLPPKRCHTAHIHVVCRGTGFQTVLSPSLSAWSWPMGPGHPVPPTAFSFSSSFHLSRIFCVVGVSGESLHIHVLSSFHSHQSVLQLGPPLLQSKGPSSSSEEENHSARC